MSKAFREPDESRERAPAVVLFDGVCNLCNAGINWIIDHDPDARFLFLSLQSQAGCALAERVGLDQDRLSTMVLIRGGRSRVRSDAVLTIASELETPWSKPARVAKCLPRFLRDLVYRLVGRLRYRLMGKRDACRVPTPETARRFPDPDDVEEALVLAGFGET